jgi:adenylate cyclase
MRTSIYGKIFGIAIGLILLMVVVAVASSLLVNQVRRQLLIQSELLIPINHAVAAIESNILEQEVQLERLHRLHVMAGVDPAAVASTKTRLEELHASNGDLFLTAYDLVSGANLEDVVQSAQVEMVRVRTLIQGIEQAYRNYYGHSRTIISLIDQGREGEVPVLDELTAGEETELDVALDALRDESERFVDEAIGASAKREAWLSMMILALTGGAILLGLPAAAVVTRGLVAPVRRLMSGVQAVRAGDLAFDVAVQSRDEIGQLALGFKEMVAGLRAKKQITETFGTYIDPRVVARLIEDPELAKPVGDRRTMTVFFSDIAGFTKISTELTAPALVRLLNRYFTMMTAPIRARGGVIDKYIGDAIMAYWGPPFVEAGTQATDACEAALGQLSQLAAFQREVPEILGLRAHAPEINLRVGLATGPLVVGTVGSDVSRNYTVIGEPVNLAARLESVGKLYQVSLVVDEATRAAANGFRFRELDQVRVALSAEPVRIFELRGRAEDDGDDALIAPFERALVAYRGRAFEEAEAGFLACLEIDPSDGASRLYLDRLAALRNAPPGDDWDGVWDLRK